MKRIVVVIPAYNAAAKLEGLVREIRRLHKELPIVVIDDGSADDTGRIASGLKVEVVRHSRNLGKGEALKSGFAFAVAHGFDAVVTMDADHQHLPEEIQRFIDRYCDEDTLLVGVRRLERNMPFARKVSNSLTSFVSSLFGTQRILDSQSGFRLIPAKILREITLTSSRFDLEPELLIKAARRGFRIESVPISTVYNSGRSWINPPVDTIRFLILLVKSLFW